MIDASLPEQEPSETDKLKYRLGVLCLHLDNVNKAAAELVKGAHQASKTSMQCLVLSEDLMALAQAVYNAGAAVTMDKKAGKP